MTTNTLLLGIVLSCMVFSCLSSNFRNDSNCPISTIRVVGNGQINLDADIATIYAYITQDAVTVSEAMKKVDAVLNAI